MERRRTWYRTVLLLVGSVLVSTVTMPPPASADLSVSTNQRSAKVWQKHAEKTKAYKGYKSVPKQPAPTRGRMVPISGLTAQDVTRRVQTELDNSSPCKYFYDRNQFCTYSLADVPNSKPKKGKKPAKGQPASYVVQITPEQAAMMAVAQLRLPAVAPGIGPDPSINRWNMAAVGYPLWLWADGRTHVGPVSQSVANLYVSLDARLTSVTYEMGDGHTVRCAGPGTKWTRSVKAGQPGSCGYRYTRASLPKGSYTVRAVSHWSVTWVVGGQSGVVPMDQEGTRQLAVGELQVLIR